MLNCSQRKSVNSVFNCWEFLNSPLFILECYSYLVQVGEKISKACFSFIIIWNVLTRQHWLKQSFVNKWLNRGKNKRNYDWIINENGSRHIVYCFLIIVFNVVMGTFCFIENTYIKYNIHAKYYSNGIALSQRFLSHEISSFSVYFHDHI